MKKVYISGRISSLPKDQYMKMFNIAASMLRKAGFIPVNPTHFWLCKWYNKLEWLFGEEMAYRIVLLYDLWRLMRCDMIYKIPGWQQSKGANIESCVAYHFKIWPVVLKQRGKIDKQMEKLMLKYNKQQENENNGRQL